MHRLVEVQEVSLLLTERSGSKLGYRGHETRKPSELMQGTLDVLLLKRD